MKLLRHPVAALVLVAVFATLFVTIYTGLEDHYGIVRSDVKNLTVNTSDPNYVSEGNIVEQFEQMYLLSGIEDINTGILKLKPPTGSNLDLLGGLSLVGIGSMKTILGIVTVPFEMIHIITEFYGGELPTALLGDLALIVVVYLFFILLSAKVGKDV